MNKDKVRELYLVEKLAASRIAMQFGCSVGPVYRALREMNITRTRSEAQSLQLKGRHPGNYKGGKYKEDTGYILIYLQPDDPFRPMADKRGYVREHRLVVAKALGRCLEPWEIVHHKGAKYSEGSIENKSDNRYPENLELIPSQSKHLPSARAIQELVRLRNRVAKLEDELKICKAALIAEDTIKEPT